MRCLDAGEGYLARGWNPVALCPPSHCGVPSRHRASCRKPGKAPLYAWSHLHDEVQTLSRLRWEFQRHPNANLGVVLGPVSNLVGVDCDDEASFAAVEAMLGGDIPPGVFSFRTGRGVRLLFGYPEDAPARSGLLPGGAELLSGGRQTVVPPSRHLSGVQYAWLKYAPAVSPPRPLPRVLADAVSGGASEKFPRVAEGEAITDGRKRRLFSLACSLRRYGATPAEVRRCLDVFNGRCSPPLEESRLDDIAASACRYAPSY